MRSFKTLTATMLPFPSSGVDTDQIYPARYLTVIEKEGLGKYLFADFRYTAEGKENPAFILNTDFYRNSKILIAGDDFGIGSSREHAPWALVDYGFRVVISTSFGDIFQNNSLKNGLLPIIVNPDIRDRLMDLAQTEPHTTITVDLAAQKVMISDVEIIEFEIDGFAKRCLIEGLDQLGYLLSHRAQVEEYEQNLAYSEGVLK